MPPPPAAEAPPPPLTRRQAGLLAAILLAAALLRFADLAQPAFWEDEIVTVQNLYAEPWLPPDAGAVDHDRLIARPRVSGWGEYLDNLFAHEDSPPLYFAVIRAWSFVFGISEVRLRLFSAAAGLLAVGLFFGLARRLLPTAHALAGTLILAVHPFAVEYSREARPYALVLLLAVAALRLLWVIGPGGGAWWHRALFVAVNAALLYTHYHTAFFLAAEALAFLLVWRRPAGLLWLGAAGALFLPGALPLFRKLVMLHSGTRQIWVQTGSAPATLLGWLDTAKILPKKYVVGSFLPADYLWYYPPMMLVGLLVAVRLTASARAGWRRDRRATGFLLTFILAPLAFSLAADLALRMNTLQVPRYLMFLFPAVLLLAVGPLERPAGRWLDGTLAVLLAAGMGAGLLWHFTHGKQDFDWRGRVRELQARTAPEDPVAADYERDALLVGWYLEAPRRILLKPPVPELRQVLRDRPGGTLAYLPRVKEFPPGRPDAFPRTRLSPLEEDGGLLPLQCATNPRHYRAILYYRIAGDRPATDDR